jgi:hypothetical protein
MNDQPRDEAELVAEVDRFIEEQRIACLWYVRPDFRPTSRLERVRALQQIERHGDVDAFRRAATLKRWLLQISSDASADSQRRTVSPRAKATSPAG